MFRSKAQNASLKWAVKGMIEAIDKADAFCPSAAGQGTACPTIRQLVAATAFQNHVKRGANVHFV